MIEESLGESLRRLREQQGISLRSLAEKSGFSAGFISQIEKGQSSPSIVSMEKIAAALGVTLWQFFRSAESTRPNIVRADQRQRLSLEWSRADLHSLGSVGGATQMQATMMHLEPGGQSGKSAKPADSDEWAFVHSGDVVLVFDHAEQQLSAGDCATIPAGTSRRWVNQSDTGTQVLIITLRQSK